MTAYGDGGVLDGGEVAADVEGEAVHADPVADTDADGGDFSVDHPCAGEAFAAAGCDAEVGANFDQQVLEGAQVAMKVLTMVAEVEDGIADELAGAVIGGLAAAIDLDDGMGKMRGAAQAGLVRGAANGVNRVVLEEQELIGDGAGAALGNEAVLEGEGLPVIDPAQPLDGKGVQVQV